jgi:hypothetical protein
LYDNRQGLGVSWKAIEILKQECRRAEQLAHNVLRLDHSHDSLQQDKMGKLASSYGLMDNN